MERTHSLSAACVRTKVSKGRHRSETYTLSDQTIELALTLDTGRKLSGRHLQAVRSGHRAQVSTEHRKENLQERLTNYKSDHRARVSNEIFLEQKTSENCDAYNFRATFSAFSPSSFTAFLFTCKVLTSSRTIRSCPKCAARCSAVSFQLS